MFTLCWSPLAARPKQLANANGTANLFFALDDQTHSWLEISNPLTMKDLPTSTIILYSVVCPKSSVY
jgi:hypothetical protein